MTILHGDNTTQSRQALTQLIDQAHHNQVELSRLEADKLSPAQLEEVLGGVDLFESQKLIVVEGLHSLPTSNRKKDLIALLTVEADRADLVLWEKKTLTANILKKFPKAKVQEFKISKALFKWLDSLGSKMSLKNQIQLLHEAIEQDGDHFCFLMLARQIRLLIQSQEGSEIKGPPFVVSKIKQQAKQFSRSDLLSLHNQLFNLDHRQKTSRNFLPLAQELDLLVINVYK